MSVLGILKHAFYVLPRLRSVEELLEYCQTNPLYGRRDVTQDDVVSTLAKYPDTFVCDDLQQRWSMRSITYRCISCRQSRDSFIPFSARLMTPCRHAPLCQDCQPRSCPYCGVGVVAYESVKLVDPAVVEM